MYLSLILKPPKGSVVTIKSLNQRPDGAHSHVALTGTHQTRVHMEGVRLSLFFSLCHKHTHSGDWNPVITEQQSPLTTGWPWTDHVMVRSLGPSTEKHFPTLQIQGQFYSFPPGHWGCEGVIKLIHRLHLREISFQSCAVIQNLACVSSWLLQEHEFIFVLFPLSAQIFDCTVLVWTQNCCVGWWNYNLVCFMSVFSFYPQEEDEKGELPAAPHSNESRWNNFYVLRIINWFGFLMVIMLLF